MNPQDAKRIRDLRGALRRVKPGDLLSLEEVALLWGVHKSRFVTVRNGIADFPDPQPAPKDMGLAANSLVYPARAAIEAMERHASRHETAARARANRTAAMLGRARNAAEDDVVYSASDLQRINRTAAEIEEREREQRLYVPGAEVSAIAGEVFSEISDFFATLSNKLDPHGVLPPQVRADIDDRGRELLLLLHRRMKDMLEPDAVSQGNRDQARRAGKTRSRRVGARRVRGAAG